jgi:hypothetical protein
MTTNRNKMIQYVLLILFSPVKFIHYSQVHDMFEFQTINFN